MSNQTDPNDTQTIESEPIKTNTCPLSSSFNIVTKKPASSNAVFIVPQQNISTEDNSTNFNQLINTFSPPTSNLILNDDKNSSNNKVTLIPLNLNSQTSSSSPIKLPLSTTPIKSLNETTTKTFMSPIIGSKKVIISAPNSSVSSSGLNQTTLKTASLSLSSNNGIGDKSLISTFNSRLPPANTKIFTISTQNNLKTVTSQQPTNNSSTQLNISTINTTSLSNSLNNNPNKIQYVKIVNTANNTQKIQMHQQTIPTTVSLSSSNSITANKAIKITTISANTNTNAITTTTTNNSSTCLSPQSGSSNLDANLNNTNRSLSSILSTVTPVSNSTTPKQQMNESLPETSSSTSALFEAINSNGQLPSSTTNSSLKLHTYQLVSSNNSNQTQPKITTTTKTPVIQRIQSINQYNNQPITKTIVSATTPSSNNQQQSHISNYKVLTQQLPAGSSQSSPFAFKSLNTTNLNNPNKISVTKTISSNNNSLDDLTANRKQIITTVRNGEQTNIRQPITQVASNSNQTLNSVFNVKNTKPISVSNVLPSVSTNINSANQNLDDNQKSTLETFSKIFNTTSPSALASSSSSILTNSPGKQRLNVNRNSANYDQSLASPPLSLGGNSTPASSSAAIPAVLSSNNRKPCNCTKSMCLKLYCDCFAMGSFCHDCNCINCFNTLEHEDERNKAIKMVLDRNPQAFQSKIGKFTAQIALPKPIPTPSEEPMSVETSTTTNTEEIDEIQSRHIKGCNCKKSNCLKRYCECYLAKIQCSTLCKCVGCKNCDESTKTLLQLANSSDIRKQQQHQQQQNQLLKNNKILMSQQTQNNLFNTTLPSSSSWRTNSMHKNDLTNKHNSFNSFDLIARSNLDQFKLEQQQTLNRSYAMLTNEAIEVTCSKLIEKVAEELSRLNCNDNDDEKNVEKIEFENELAVKNSDENDELMETLIIEEFGRCLVEIIDTAEKRNKF